VGNRPDFAIIASDCCADPKENRMKSRAKFLDYTYEEVLDTKTRELIRVGCAVAVGCPD